MRAEDLALLKDVDRVCAEIVRMEEGENAEGGDGARVDLLVMSQAYLSFEARRGEEGLLVSVLFLSPCPIASARSLPTR